MKNLAFFKIWLAILCLNLTTASAQQLFSHNADYIYKLPQRAAGLKLVDVSGDGKVDIFFSAVASAPDSLYLLNGNSNGTFLSNTRLPRAENYYNALDIADFNKDNITDYVLSSYWDNGITVHLGKAIIPIRQVHTIMLPHMTAPPLP